MGHIASAFYDNPTSELKVVAVTGTNGKTTTVSLLHSLFRIMDRKAGLVGTIENKINDRSVDSTHTTPDSIAIQKLFREMVDEGCKYCFIEASSHAIYQNRLSGAKLAGAVFTNITHDHLDYHQTFDNYLSAKKKLFDQLQSNSFALINADDKHHEDIAAECNAYVISYGVNSYADEKARIIENQLQGLHLRINGQDLYSQLVGGFNASNLLGVFCVAKNLGFDPLNILTSMSLLSPPPGRFELVESPDGITAIVDYAHTPDALKNIINSINEIKTNKEVLITIIGCGGGRDK